MIRVSENSQAHLPGYGEMLWLFFMQPLALHRRLNECGINNPAGIAFKLWRQGKIGQCYVLRMLTVLVAVLVILVGLSALIIITSGFKLNQVNAPLALGISLFVSVFAGLTAGIALGFVLAVMSGLILGFMLGFLSGFSYGLPWAVASGSFVGLAVGLVRQVGFGVFKGKSDDNIWALGYVAIYLTIFVSLIVRPHGDPTGAIAGSVAGLLPFVWKPSFTCHALAGANGGAGKWVSLPTVR